MAKNNHQWKYKQRKSRRMIPELGYYLILTDTKETEKNYFEGLKNSLPQNVQDKIRIKVIKADTEDLIATALEYRSKESQYSEMWIVLDRDLVVDFDSIVASAKKHNIKVGWSNPCFEIWLSAYFGKMPNWASSVECCKGFEKVFKKYTNKEYVKNSKTIYKDLIHYGNEEIAIKLAKQKYKEAQAKSKFPSRQYPASTVFELVQEINKKY